MTKSTRRGKLNQGAVEGHSVCERCGKHRNAVKHDKCSRARQLEYLAEQKARENAH